MNFLKKRFPKKIRFFNKIFFYPEHSLEIHNIQNFFSEALQRTVSIDVFLPPGHYAGHAPSYPTLFLNDGQDMPAVGLADTLERLWAKSKIPEIIVVAIHADENRMQEYGIAGKPDYKDRGARAQEYADFLLRELLPELRKRYRIAALASQTAVAGFSLGGLSAFGLAWNHPGVFGKVGVFSGSLWWRSRAFTPGAPDAHRIVHEMVAGSAKRDGLRFWLQAGTEDEQEDRNNNGIIDAIDDTLDLIKALKKLGYREGQDIRYVQVEGGQHNPATWGKVMPDFLRWAFREAPN
ncbi:MAG: esterase family protein [Phaeodactylibacter sp.]|nr:esterase family protein [Phaeodactylibacter sp.]MCB9296592.1 esterase family protein [Lewinellaceae bacterium]